MNSELNYPVHPVHRCSILPQLTLFYSLFPPRAYVVDLNSGFKKSNGTPIALSHFKSSRPAGRCVTKSFFKENAMLTTFTSALLAQTVVFPPGLVSSAIVFFIIAILAYVLGARGVAGMSAGIGRTLLFVFLVLAVLVFVFSFVHTT